MNLLVEFNNVFFSYQSASGKPVEALREITLQIGKGEFLSIIGRNGSGKSTLARHFNGLLTPTSGEVLVAGLSTSTGDRKQLLEIRKRVGMVFQNPDNQLVSSIVEEDVAFGPENLGIPPPEIRKRVNHALAALNMFKYRREPICHLSEGQKQLVAIAGALAMKPDCIVLDEPTAQLDPCSRKQVLESLKKLNRDEGIAIVFITHLMSEAVNFDRVVVMEQGEVKVDGLPEDIFSRVELLEKAGLDIPVAARLAVELRQRGFPVAPGILRVEELVNSLCQLK
ncbi:MAG TPA: energy-coupling factor transporter ATPase [Bacillota bacterium]|nr:energy-coupling factor transporter ATPase [Bacillota bacterium]HOA36081.1 energy-coupling factor transporter ATPase [Bacillota bacterium]HPZ10885.1 energy-coupling factor transporter ATPase [Bacillota bacterium]HQE09051.1 energy-coupling factor transporter ATPase [Bacillota bacterium]